MDPVKYIHTEDVHNLMAPGIVVPILIEMFKPNSVLDVGCGTGTWLKCLTDRGVNDVIGIDGDYVDRALLAQNITKEQFIGTDLTIPFDLGRKFDLVMSLEVAEHLPKESAEDFIYSLAQHGDTVVFSAAIPHQGGQNHLNEQWVDYWVQIFDSFGYVAYDILRPRIWEDKSIDWWYRQNMLVFSKQDFSMFLKPRNKVLDLVHPELFMQHIEYIAYLQGYVKELEEKIR